MAITPEADKEVAKEQLRHLRGQKTKAKLELDSISNEIVQARRAVLRDRIDVLTQQIALVKQRVPDDPGGPIDTQSLKVTTT